VKHPAPNPAGTSGTHWQAAREGRLALPWCASCARYHWPVRAACPHCGGVPVWRDASGTGTIAAWSIVRRAVNPELADATPYVIAFVELDEGVRIFTNIVDCDLDSVKVGQKVKVVFKPSEGGGKLACFTPV